MECAPAPSDEPFDRLRAGTCRWITAMGRGAGIHPQRGKDRPPAGEPMLSVILIDDEELCWRGAPQLLFPCIAHSLGSSRACRNQLSRR